MKNTIYDYMIINSRNAEVCEQTSRTQARIINANYNSSAIRSQNVQQISSIYVAQSKKAFCNNV